MSCATVNIQCDDYQNFGCIFIGTSKFFTGQFVDQVTGAGIDVVGTTLSLLIASENTVILEKRKLFEAVSSNAYGLWEIMLNTEDTEKLVANTKYEVEFQLSDAGANPEERIILGVGCISAVPRLHALT